MCRELRVLVFAGLFAAAVLSACPGPPPEPPSGNPDLVPVPQILSFTPLSVDFCKRDSAGKLVVTVRNQGSGNASASKTAVEFFPGGIVPTGGIATEAIPAGEVKEVAFDIPAGCFNPDCEFRITVDAGNNVSEGANEGNNSADGRCIG